MALNIKNLQVEVLVADVANLTSETKTEAIRQALAERLERLQLIGKKKPVVQSLFTHLEQNVWPFVPEGELGRVLTRDEEDHILGYGPDGF